VPTVTGVHMDRLHPTFLDQLHRLANAAQHDIWCQSTGRTDAEQAVLYYGWIHHLPGYAPANPPGGPSWHRFIPGVMHAQAADISTVGLGGASARSVFGPYAGRVGLEFAIASESWHIQPAGWVKHPEVPFTSGPPVEDDMPKKIKDLSCNINVPQDYAHPVWRTIRGLLAAWGEQTSPNDTNEVRTKAAVISWQTKWAGVVGRPDGVFGPKSWTFAISALNG
jgi:hypothetical protein